MSGRCIKTGSRAAMTAALVIAGMFCPIRPAAQSEQSKGNFEQALTEFRAGNYASAAAKFARVEQTSPGVTDALLYQAKCFVHLENFAGAEQALRTFLNSHSDAADAAYMLGFVLHRENRPSESLAAYTQAAAITRPTADDLKIVGLDYVLLNDYADAVKWLQEAVEFDSNNKDAWYYLGRACYTRGMLPEARRAFQRVLALDAHDARAENNLGLIFETEGQVSAAIAAYRQAIAWQENSHPSEQPYVNLGSLLMEQGESREALDALQKAAQLAPANAYCHLKLGMLYRKNGRLDEAQAELERATQLEPDNAISHYQLGRVYKERNSLARAQAEFDRAAELQARAAGSQAEPTRH